MKPSVHWSEESNITIRNGKTDQQYHRTLLHRPPSDLMMTLEINYRAGMQIGAHTVSHPIWRKSMATVYA